MDKELFADAVAEITLTGPLARLDLASFSVREKDEKGQPKLELRQRVVMPLEGFVRTFGLMAQVMQQLEKQGVIKRVGGEAQVATDTAPPKSANFK